MRSRVLWRRSATALGVSTATALGFLTTVVAPREPGVGDYARRAAVLAATPLLRLSRERDDRVRTEALAT